MKILNPINSIVDYIQLTLPKKKDRYIYRGLSSIDYPLIPRVGRYYYIINFNSKNNFLKHEEAAFNLFSLKAKHLAPYNFNDKYMILAIAQHNGLATRLMDWTFNPLVALFFAVEKNLSDSEQKNCVVYKLKRSRFNNDIDFNGNPFSIQNIKYFAPYGITQRIIVQQGVFTVHNDPTKPFDHPYLEKIPISIEARKEIKSSLYEYGISRETLFPDLDGISQTINYLKFEIEIEK